MKKIVFFIISGVFLLTLPSWANIFEPYAIKKIPGAFYFTPSASSMEFALFGYMSKITPTPEEIEAEKKRINAIIDKSIKKEYGSWENLEKEMREAGKETAQKESKEAPSWVNSLLPPSLMEEAVPLLMKGALLYSKAHPEAMREPVGNVGETGVIVVDPWGDVAKIPLGINTPVVSIDISPDGWTAAVLTDMSFEDENGRLHPLGEISLLDLRSKKRTYSRIFANLAEHVAFVPGLNLLSFEYYTDMKDFGKKEVRFIDLKSKQVTKIHFRTYGNGSTSIYGKKVHYPNVIFAPNQPIVALYDNGFFEIYDILTGRKLLKVLNNGFKLAFAHRHPWVFTGIGELWDYQNKKLIAGRRAAPYLDAKFSKDDDFILYVEQWGVVKRFDTRSKTVVKTGDFSSKAGLFFFTPDDRLIITFVEGNGLVSYQKSYLRRRRACLRMIATEDLRAKQNICVKDATVVDAAMPGNTLVVSDFDKLHVYVNAASMASAQPLPAEPHGSLLEKIEKNPGRFANKIVELDGWAWGWMARPPEGVRLSSLRFARHNYGSRSDGTFTDGVVQILYPVPVKFSGPFHLKARVTITPGGWQLVPVD